MKIFVLIVIGLLVSMVFYVEAVDKPLYFLDIRYPCFSYQQS